MLLICLNICMLAYTIESYCLLFSTNQSIFIFQQQFKTMFSNMRPYTNTASGNLNQKYEQKYKQINLDDLDIEMISPQFLNTKTLKKPLQESDIMLARTNPSGVRASNPVIYEEPIKQYPAAVIFKKDQQKIENKKNNCLSIIDTSELNIKPAYKASNLDSQTNLGFGSFMVPEKDNNTILSALMKKGLKPAVVVKPQVLLPKEEKKIGPAQAKLKAMIQRNEPKQTKNKQITISIKPVKKEDIKKSQPSQIGEEIGEEMDDYGNQSFEKLSGAYESAIKESIAGESQMIKESFAGESQMIKESIRQSIRQSMNGSSSRIRESIREDIRESLHQSGRSMKEEIIEEISNSFKKSKESIEEVYEEIFQEESLSNSLSKSQNKFKKSNNNYKESDSLSQSASKSFRMKTNIAKSLKFAEELKSKQRQLRLIDDKKMKETIDNQKSSLKKIQQNVTKLLGKQNKSALNNKNKDLYYNFKVQINKLITSDNFQSKLKKLVSFLSVGSDITPSKNYVDQLEDNILKNVLQEINSIKLGKAHLNQVEAIKKQYEEKLKEQLRIQEVNMRAEINQKLSEKDSELKKMIAELQARMMSRTVHVGGYSHQRPTSMKSEHYEIESDYSIDSDNISWKADLWQLLPQYQKKKLYQKQTAEVTKFLADVMINELKEEALQRSLDISFEFPEQFNNLGSSKVEVKSKNQIPFSMNSFAKKQMEVKHERSSEFLADLPKINIKKNVSVQPSPDISQTREEVEHKYETVRKDDKIKSQVIKILAEYKTIYLKKKQEIVKKLIKVLTSKNTDTQKYLYSSLQEITILTEKQFKKDHQLYIRAYEQELIWSLLGIYNRCLNKKVAVAEQEMKKMYDRLVVVSQVATAERCVERVALDIQKDSDFNVESLTKEALKKMQAVPCAIEIVANDNYMDLKAKKEEKQIQNELVTHIVNILSAEFAQQFPKSNKSKGKI